MQIEFVDENHLDLFVKNQMRLAMGAAKHGAAFRGDDSTGQVCAHDSSTAVTGTCQHTQSEGLPMAPPLCRTPKSQSPLPEVSIVSASPGSCPSLLHRSTRILATDEDGTHTNTGLH